MTESITVHITDIRGVYLRTVELSIYAEQPEWAVYDRQGDTLPATEEGFTRMRIDGSWQQVPDADVPPMPETEPEPAPTSCTRRQGRLALLAHGHLDDVEAAIAAISVPIEQRAAQIEYEADTWERSNPFVQQMWAQLGGTPAQLDDLFRLAVTL